MKESIKTITLKRLITAASTVVLLILFFVAYNFRELTLAAMTDKGNSVARFVEAGLMTHMKVSTHQEKEQYLKNIQQVSGVKNLEIIRSDKVASQYNLPSHTQRFDDPIIAQVFSTALPSVKLVEHNSHKNMLRVTFPYIAEPKLGIDCTQCHNVPQGTVLGAIDFYIDMDSYKEMSINYLYVILAILTLILIAILIMMFRIIDRHIKHPLDTLMDDTKRSYETHQPINIDAFESLELQDVAQKVNLFNDEVIKQYEELKEKNRLLNELNHEIEATQREVINTMGNIAESRSKETAYHVQRVAAYSYLLGQKYGLSEEECTLLRDAAPMHDIGKVGIPDTILCKPAKLNDDEFEKMKEHAQMGYDIFKHSNRPMLKAAAIIAHEHHEHWDGNGYPRGIKADNIHIFGRIVAIADVFDALGTERIYKESWPLQKIIELFQNERGRQFDPDLVDLFLKHLDEILELQKQYS